MQFFQSDHFFIYFTAGITIFALGAMMFYYYNQQNESEILTFPSSTFATKNKKKNQKKRDRVRRSSKVISGDDSAEEGDAVDASVSNPNDPLGLGIDPQYLPSNSKKRSNSFKKQNQKLNRKQTNDYFVPPVEDTDSAVVASEDEPGTPKDVSTDSGIREDNSQAIEPVVSPVNAPTPVDAPVKKAKNSQKNKKNKKSTSGHSDQATSAEDEKPFKDEVFDVEERISPVSSEVVVSQNIQVQPPSDVFQPEAVVVKAPKQKNHKSKKNHTKPESGDGLLDSFLGLVDGGYYDDNVLNEIKSILQDSVGNCRESWKKFNDPEEKYRKHITALEESVKINTDQLVKKEEMIAELKADYLKKNREHVTLLTESDRKLEAARIEKNALEKTLAGFRKELETLQHENKSASLNEEAVINDLKQALQDARGDLSLKESIIGDLNVRHQQLELTLNHDFQKRFDEQNIKHRQEIELLNLKLSENVQTIEAAKEQILHLNQQINQVDSQNSSQREVIDSLNSIIHTNQLNSAEQRNSLEKQIELLQIENSNLQKALNASNDVKNVLEKQFNDVREEIKQKTADFQNVLGKKAEAISSIDELNAQIVQLKKDNQTQTANAQKYEEQVRKITADFDKSKKNYEAQLESRKKIDQELEVKNKEIQSLKLKCDESLEQAKTAQSRNAVLKQCADNLVSQNSKISEKLQKEFNEKLESARKTEQELRRELEKKPKVIEVASPVPQPDTSRLEELERKNVDLSRTCERLTATIDSLKKEKDSSVSKSSKFDEGLDILQNRINVLDNSVQSVLEVLEKECDSQSVIALLDNGDVSSNLNVNTLLNRLVLQQKEIATLTGLVQMAKHSNYESEESISPEPVAISELPKSGKTKINKNGHAKLNGKVGK